MTDNKTCPSCGATLDSNVGSQCPFCGSALTPANSSAQTLISRPLSKKAEFENSAEAMDEVKRLVSEGETAAAAQVASEQFDLNTEDAKSTVDQVQVDMQYSSNKTMLAGHAVPVPPPPPPVVEQAAYSTPPAVTPVSYSPPPAASSFEEVKQPSKNKNWIIGGSIGAVVFLCLCCCLLIVISLLPMIRNSR